MNICKKFSKFVFPKYVFKLSLWGHNKFYTNSFKIEKASSSDYAINVNKEETRRTNQNKNI